MADMQLGNAGGPLALQAATPVSGFALVNGTPNILTWTAPNDGQQHRVQVFASLHVISTETGGIVNVNFSAPDGNNGTFQLIAGSLAAGLFTANPPRLVVVQAGQPVNILQTALTAGAALLWAEIWGS
jgi:hypothetical protein